MKLLAFVCVSMQFMFYTFLRADDPDPAVRERVLETEEPDKTTHLSSKLDMAVKMGNGSKSRSKSHKRVDDSHLHKGAKKFLKSLNSTTINVDFAGKAAERSADPNDPMGVGKGLRWKKPQPLMENSKCCRLNLHSELWELTLILKVPCYPIFSQFLFSLQLCLPSKYSFIPFLRIRC